MIQPTLIIDNFDSFTYNLVHYFEMAGSSTTVIRNNETALSNAIKTFTNVVISPGPSTPGNAGYSKEIVRRFYHEKRILGICLGMQVINEVFGGKTVQAQPPVHGKTGDLLIEKSTPIFTGISSPLTVARYHSLICTHIPACLSVTSRLDDIPMSLEHDSYPVYGLQFHPESFLTEYGLTLIQNFLNGSK